MGAQAPVVVLLSGSVATRQPDPIEHAGPCL